MNVLLSQLSGENQFFRNDEIRRRNAENAYDRHQKYNGDLQKKLEQLEKMIIGKNDLEEIDPKKMNAQQVLPKQSEFQKLEAGQMKQISLPLGKTLEETIRLWREVRVDASLENQPKVANHHLSATASAQIRKVEAQIGLHQQAQSEIKAATLQDAIEVAEVKSMSHTSNLERNIHLLQKKYDRAISSYAFHVEMKKNGFAVDLPSFYRVA